MRIFRCVGTSRQTLFFVMIFLCCLVFIGLTKPMLMVPDEGRYAEIPREMLALSDFITPHLNDIQYFEKPPLMYWLQAASMALFGFTRFAVRFANATLAILQAFMLYAAAYHLFRPRLQNENTDDQPLLLNRTVQRTAWLSSVMLASSFLYFILAHFVTLDMALSTFLTGSLLCFLISVQAPVESPKQRYAFYSSAMFAGLAFLTKGLIALVLPGLIIVLWTVIYSQWAFWLKLPWFRGILLFALIAVPWHVLVQLRHPEFLHFYFMDQHFSRFLTLSAGRYKPFWFFMPVLLLGLYPWTFFLWPVLRRVWQTRDKTLGFLALWGICIVFFFSISQSKLIPYILPSMAPFILLIAEYFAAHWEKGDAKSISTTLYVTASAMYVIAFSLCLIPQYFHLNEPVMGRIILNVMSTGLLLGAIYLMRLVRKGVWQKGIIFLVGFQSVLLIYLCWNLNSLRDFSIEPLATMIQNIEKQYPHTEVVTYKTYYQDLPFYLRHRVTIVDWHNELDFGAAHQQQDWLIDEAAFLKRWKSPRLLLAIAEEAHFNDLKNNKVQNNKLEVYKIADANHQVLFSNHACDVYSQPGGFRGGAHLTNRIVLP